MCELTFELYHTPDFIRSGDISKDLRNPVMTTWTKFLETTHISHLK